MGDWLSGTSGWKYPNQYESWIGYASKIGWLIPIQRFLHLASGFTRPRGLMPPVKDPGHHLCWLSHVTCQYMPHAIRYHFCLWGAFGWYSQNHPPKIFCWTFLPQRDFFQKLWSWPTSPQHRIFWLQRLKWFSLPGIDRSRKADMAEIKPEVGRGTEICAADVSGCFFLDPRSWKLQLKKHKWYGSPMEFTRTYW